ncbi:VMAP-C domain-containing protein [Streptomyces odontomachi]|uniref:VMAP-C domain-containing protein n=1 Tax=Streptomyces odontomachi TaxID=2944940 RepID=UPI00210D3F00|nr:hypothetical protein [Streptomyces sp. ODS25]
MSRTDREVTQRFRETLLCTLLCAFPDMQRREFRRDVLTTMGLHMEVAERDVPREHVKAIVRAVLDSGSLMPLGDALRHHAPEDRALPWLELTVLAMAGFAPLPEKSMLRLIEVLRSIPYDSLAPCTLTRYAAESGGGTFAADHRTVPEILLWLADRRGPAVAEPLLRFVALLGDDPHVVRTRQGSHLRDLLADLNAPPAEGADDRLIIQIRLEATGPDHLPNSRYLLRSAYYRQRLPDGPLQRIRILMHDEAYSKDELIRKAPPQLARWAELAHEVHRAGGRVRIEFLLPASLLGHEAECWTVGPSRKALGHNYPVVIRSLERYSDPWINPTSWRRRWGNLLSSGPDADISNQDADVSNQDADVSNQDADVLSGIEWPSLELEKPGDLAEWLSERSDLACIGLSVPYNDLTPAAREAVHDALLMEGVPVMLWRRDAGDPDEVMAALRRHRPEHLSELPEAVLQCRKAGRFDEEHVSQRITLLYDDPHCVDPAQDSPYEGMA